MDFKIAGPELTPMGSLASAEYDFHLRRSVTDCLWPGEDLKTVATVSVINGGGGDNVTTTAVDVSDQWVKFTARNVVFPTVAEILPRAGRPEVLIPMVRVTVKPRAEVQSFRTCAAMRKVHRDGVSAPEAVNVVVVKGKRVAKPALGRPHVSAAVYDAHRHLDRDRDRLVCEREPRVR